MVRAGKAALLAMSIGSEPTPPVFVPAQPVSRRDSSRRCRPVRGAVANKRASSSTPYGFSSHSRLKSRPPKIRLTAVAMLILTRRVGESLKIGEEVTVSVLGIKGNQVRVGIAAPKSVAVHREEIFERIKQEQEVPPVE